jgi:hypothetical protein
MEGGESGRDGWVVTGKGEGKSGVSEGERATRSSPHTATGVRELA